MNSRVRSRVIRQARAADHAEWLRMRRLLWPDEDADKFPTEMHHLLSDPRKMVFVAERADGGLGGFLEADTREYADGCTTSPVAYIEGWFVDRDLRGHGLGRALVGATEDWARQRGLQEIGSDSQLDNDQSIQAHLALGYRDAEHSIHFAKKL